MRFLLDEPHHFLCNFNRFFRVVRNFQLIQQIGKPHDTKANEPKIERLLKIANTASTEHFPLPDGDRAQFGLDPPMAELRLDDTRLEIGGTHPIDHRRYVLVGDTVHLINDHFAHHLLAPAKDYAMPQGRIHSANND
jgi:hypothetical protein